MASTIPLKIVYLVPELGEYAVVPDGSIVNIGGVQGPNFTVGGKPLLFADGTSTDGSSVNFIKPNLQTVYDNSTGEAKIDFTSGKDFVLEAVNNNQFRFDADTGDVTISGKLIVNGGTTTVIHATIETDRVAIHPTAGDYVPFILEPLGGVVPSVNLFDIKTSFGGASVFTIGPTGETYIKNLNTGLINGVDIGVLAQTVAQHVEIQSSTIKHPAKQISVDRTPALSALPGADVQSVLESLGTTVSQIKNTSTNVRGFEHVQSSNSKKWTIVHGNNTRKVQVTIWDPVDEMLWADAVTIKDDNTVEVNFSTPTTGRAILMLF